MKTRSLVKKVGMELDCELETRGNTPRAKQLEKKLAVARAKLHQVGVAEEERANGKAKS